MKADPPLPVEADVDCDSCGAKAGEHCRTRDGRKGAHAHNARRRASIAAFQAREVQP